MVNKLVIALAFMASLMAVPSANAAVLDCVSDEISLAVLMDGNSCQVGDKLFSDFGHSVTGTGPSAADIDVLGIVEDGNFGLSFTGGFIAFANQVVDVVIRYTVTVLDPAQMLTDIHLSFNGETTGTGVAQVVEQVKDGGTIIGQAKVETPTPLSTTVYLDYGVKQAQVTKDILLAGGPNGLATISIIDQVTSQTAIPEPATITLLGSGLLAAARYGRRRKLAS